GCAPMSCTLWYTIPRMRGLRMRPSTKPSSRPISPSGYRHSSWWFNELTLDATQVPELSDPRVDTLRLFRNGCFHYQRDYQKFAPFLSGHLESFDWAERLHMQFGAYF